jgi:uncharacterized protein (DUF608 family)
MKISRRELLASAAAAPVAVQKPRATPERTTGRTYKGETLREIAFPLGGIGTGTVSLSGYGGLRDWEIFNRPNKGRTLPFTFTALRLAGGALKRPLIRVVERQVHAPYPGGFGLSRERGLGLPRFREAVFTGEYPFARIAFADARLPVQVSLEAFNPMIPLDTDNSSLPVAVLKYRIVSRAAARLDAALAFSLMNPVGYDGTSALGGRTAPFYGKNINEYRERGILMRSEKYPSDSTRFGSLALATDATDVSYRLAWEHGAWWDDFQRWWDEFLLKGRFANVPAEPSKEGETEYATLAAHFALDPGQARELTFVLAWHFPNTENYWTSEKEDRGQALRNEYGTKWPSAWEPAAHTLTNVETLRTRSAQYRDALYSSTLPEPVIDAVSSQASIIRTPTVMVLENNTTLAFEGCGDNTGCCPMNCTHVYNYEQSMAHLYPDLERSMRHTDFMVNMRPDGSMSFRTPVPLRQGGNKTHPAADGQMGCVMKVYREWRLSGDDAFLKTLWPNVKRALEYAWTSWDADRDGVMEGEQHNTYDIEFYGPNSMMGTLYLGALAAAAKMARHLGESDTAARYEALVKSGAEKLDRELWNGEFYVQRVDEKQEKAAKYQYGEGCLSDQLLGQWFAEVVELGHLLPREHVRATLASIFKHNFRTEFEDFANTQRIYALNDEAGLLLCSWPRGKRPAIPFPYSDEVWTGIEYQVAGHLMYEGMVKEGLAIVKAARDRYNGLRRNPWNEVECGHHYARAMSSWSLLTALSGFSYSAPEKMLGFRPRVNAANFRCLFSTGTSWGVFSQQGNAVELAVHGGKLEVAGLRVGDLVATFDRPREIPAGETLRHKLA